MNSTLRRSSAVVMLGATLSGCGLHGKPKVDRPSDDGDRTVATSPPTGPAGGREVVAPGIVEPWGGPVDLSAPEPGLITAILVEEGAVVRAGALLAVLDDEVQRQAVEMARADLAEARAALQKLERGATPEELRQARADYDAAVALGEFARSSAERVAQLHRDGSVSDDDNERAAADARVQAAAAERMQARLQEMERGARREDLSGARARAEAAAARLRLAEVSLERRRIFAPREGTILLSRFHPGESYGVEPEPLFVFGDVSRLQVRLEVDEIDAGAVREGAPCALYSDAGRLVATGTITRLAPKMGRRGLPIESPTSRLDVRVREVFVEIPATAGLVPGQRVWGRTQRIDGRTHP